MSVNIEHTREAVFCGKRFFSISTLYGYRTWLNDTHAVRKWSLSSEAAEQYYGTYPCQPGGGMYPLICKPLQLLS